MKTILTLLLALASFCVQAQPSTDPPPPAPTPALFAAMPELAFTAELGTMIPMCTGPNSKWNSPQFFDGMSPTFGHVTIAWCPMIDGQMAGWIRMRPPGDASVNAPIVWLTDTGRRPVPLPAFVVAANGTNKTRWSYASVTTAGKLGALVGRATVGTPCVCGNDMVVAGPATYCTFTGALLTEVTVCVPAASMATMAMPGM